MVGDAFHKRSVPWTTIALVVAATVCQLLVLVGNCATANAMSALGHSTGGWARVGKGLAHSLHIELDHGMHEVSTALVKGIGHLSVVQDSLDTVLSLLPGNMTIAFQEQPVHDEVLSLLQERQEEIEPGMGAGLALVVRDSVHKAVSAVVSKVSVVLHKFLEVIRPALVQVGEWIVRFGDRIQAGISIFSVTLDRVQKILDQIMSQLAGRGENGEAMVELTFDLFDPSNTGYVTSGDLKDVARLYRVTALQGDVPERLADIYDASGDGRLNREEMALLAEDEKLPNLMSAVLRTYGKRLAEVAGNVAAARHRDEVAQSVVDYAAVVAAKNRTKISWIADRLGNGSLPLAFTADVIAEACRKSEDRMITADTSVGQILVGAVYEQHPDHFLQAFELVMNTSFWASSGLDVRDQHDCVGMVSFWVSSATQKRSSEFARAEKQRSDSADHDRYLDGIPGLLSFLRDAHGQTLDPSLHIQIATRAVRLVSDNVAAYSATRRAERSRRVGELRSSQAPPAMMTSLLGSMQSEGDGGAPSIGDQVVSSGQLASPETLEFAQWLAKNASETAALMQDMCFVYSSESSSVLDSYAAQIQRMVGQIQAFLDSMMKYATPAGLKRLEEQIEGFEATAAADLAALVEKKVFALVNKSLPTLEIMVGTAAHKAGLWIGHEASKVIEGPLGDILAGPLAAYVAKLVQSDKAGKAVSDILGPDMARALANLTADTLADSAGRVLEALMEQALVHGADFVNSSVNRATDTLIDKLDDLIPSLVGKQSDLLQASLREALHANPKQLHAALLQMASNASRQDARHPRSRDGDRPKGLHSERSTLDAMKSKYLDEFEVEDPPGGAWGDLVQVVRALADALPTTVRTVKLARKEVSKVASNLDSVFSILDRRGQALFDSVSKFWRTLWVLYFCSLLPLHCYILYYAFWAGGFFGGPSPLTEDEDAPVEPPKSFAERVSLCMESCSVCMKKYHDTELCFWSVILLLQVVVLLLFIVSILVCAVAGVRAFVQAGCTQMYVLGDDNVCRDEVANLRRFLSTFFIREAVEPLYGVCGRNHLLTCQLIQDKMVSSSKVVCVFSVLGTLFGLHLVVNSAVLHEQARWRRLAAAAMRDSSEDVGAPASVA